MAVNERLREWLRLKRIPNRELADGLKLTEGAVSSILSGRNNLSFNTFVKLLELYPDLCPRWILLGDDGLNESVCVKFKTTEKTEMMLLEEIAMLKEMIEVQKDSLESKERVINILAKMAP